MSSRKRRGAEPSRRAVLGGLAGLAGAGLAGCGFRPLYGRHGTGGPAVHEALSQISVGIIPDREGQILRNELLARLNPGGRPQDPRFRLDVGLNEERQNIGLTAIDTITRVNLILRARFVLTGVEDERPLLRDQVTAIAGFEVLDDEVATLAAEIDARRRALVQLAEQIRRQLAMSLAAEAAQEAGT